ncbi:hypothetical protein BOTCAL_0052g00360 [Botryotinia calthae]|uniref:Uncharacterized protein n=1 Tax=Botryotinia calthae TaxID=38488 RepID=A0A4Y8DD53_9HELO|nr:hypothetical protein BOTCAL_0052g00360 [Botryotinia calthae]
MARIELPPRPKRVWKDLRPLMAPLITPAVPEQKKRSKRPRKRRKGKTLITRAVDQLTAILKKPQSMNIEKAEACFKVMHAKMKAYEQEREGRGKWNAAAARLLEARLGKTYHEDRMNEYLEAAEDDCKWAYDICYGVPQQTEFIPTQYLKEEEYWNQYPEGRLDAFVVHMYDTPGGFARFTLEDGTPIKTEIAGDSHFNNEEGNQL